MKKNILKAGVLTLVLAFCVQFSAAQAVQKKQLVDELVNATFEAFPTDIIDNSVEQMARYGAEGIKKEIGNLVAGKIDSSELTAERKDAAKAAIPAFTEQLGEKFRELLNENLTMNDWIKESMTVNYDKQFTVAELKQLVAFFKSPSGGDFLILVKEFASAEMEKRAAQTDGLVGKASEAKIMAFLNTPTGKKFIDKFTDDNDKILEKRIDEWGELMLKKVEQDMESGELNKILMDFISENIG